MNAIEESDFRPASEKRDLRNLRRICRAILREELEQSHATEQPPRSNDLPRAEERAASRENEIVPFLGAEGRKRPLHKSQFGTRTQIALKGPGGRLKTRIAEPNRNFERAVRCFQR